MFSLILFHNDPEPTSYVVDEKQIKSVKNGLVKVKWGTKTIEAKLIESSEDRDKLENMVISQDGEIMTDSENPPGTSAQVTSSRISTRIAKRKEAEKEKKTLDKSKLQADDARSEALLHRKGFANEKNDAEKSAGAQPSTELPQDIDVTTPSASQNTNQISTNGGTAGDPEMDEIRRAVEDIFFDYTRIVAAIDNLGTKLHKVMNQLSINKPSKDGTMREKISPKFLEDEFQQSAMNTNLQKLKKSSEIVELNKGSDVWINCSTLRDIKRYHQDNPGEMVRKLMKNILGDDSIKNYTPTGANGFTAIPKKILDAVEDYVSKHVVKAKILEHKKYMRILTTMCNKARKPTDKDADDGKNERNDVKKDSGKKEKAVKPAGETNKSPEDGTKSNATDLKPFDNNTGADMDNISSNILNLHGQANRNETSHTHVPPPAPTYSTNNVDMNNSGHYSGSQAPYWGNNHDPYYGNYNSWWNNEYYRYPFLPNNSNNSSEHKYDFQNSYAAPKSSGNNNAD